MLATTKSLSLIEQKKLQWAKEREEMVGLCGLWGRVKVNNLDNNIGRKDLDRISQNSKESLLPPIKSHEEYEDSSKGQYKREEESETSGYLSDSPKHFNARESYQDYRYPSKDGGQLNNESVRDVPQQHCTEVDKTENFWADKKMYKNYKNENWSYHNTESIGRHNPRYYHPANKNYWYGTPESVSSDDGNRLRWGDRGVGIGHLWEPVVNSPDSRLPQVGDPYRQTPKWVEKGLKNADGNKADILIIHHPDDDDHHPHKNFLLGQNAPISPEVIEERERRRQKALEHQNAIKKQLEERELKRKQERENRIREEKLEEERIKKEQEIERLRYEEEQRKLKEKEELERRKEEAMREAIAIAEKRAKEEKRRNKRHAVDETVQKNFPANRERPGKLGKVQKETETSTLNKKHFNNTPREPKKPEEPIPENDTKFKQDQKTKMVKDSASQFEEIQLANTFQFLNVNGLPVDGGLALMLDSPAKDNSFILPPEGVQLALLMSPRNGNTASRLIPMSPPGSVPLNTTTGERILTPSKYRLSERSKFIPTNKATQTNLKYVPTWPATIDSSLKGKKQSRRSKLGTNSGSSGASQRCANFEKHHRHVRCVLSSKYHSKSLSSKMSLEDRPKWGINRPSVQYKKQSEKDPHYQKKVKERLKKAAEMAISPKDLNKQEEKIEDFEEKDFNSDVQLLECQTDDNEKIDNTKDDIILQNGYRMNSNSSSPVFVPIDNRLKSCWEEEPTNLELDTQRTKSDYSSQFENEDTNEGEEEEEEEEEGEEEETELLGSIGYLTQTQLEAIKQLTSLREGLQKLHKDFSNSRSVTPFSDKSSEK